MKYKKRNLVLSILVLSIFLLQSTALASAAHGIIDPDPPPPTYITYTFTGFVRESGTNIPLVGAYVTIYKGTSTYLGGVYTDGNGRYSFTKRTTLMISCMTVASKSGYTTSTISVPEPDCMIVMDHYLVQILPSAPTISNIAITQGDAPNVAVSWDVTWGTGATECFVECYWGTDANLDLDDRIYNQAVSSSTTSFSCPVPTNLIAYTGGTYYYKVYAKNTNTAGTSDDTIGPSIIEISAFWKIYPTADAYVDEENDNVNYGNLPELKVLDYQGYNRRSYLKFSIDNPEVVKSVTLCAYAFGVESNGHGIIRAYSAATSWDEYLITELHPPSLGDWITDDVSGSAGSWDYWDITDTAARANTISICLLSQSGINTGANYYSREFSNLQYRPYLSIQYWGAPQEPILVSGNEATPFVDEHFNNPNLDSDAWASHSYSPATEWNYEITRDGISYYEDTNLRFSDNFITQHSEWRGYYFDQENLDIQDSFRFETKLGWALESSESPAVQIGVELRDAGGNTITCVYFDYRGYWSPYAYIHGDIGTTSFDWSNTLKPPIITEPHDAMFEIERNLEGQIILTYWEIFAQGFASYPHEILTGIDNRNVTTVRLFCREKTPYDNAATFNAWFDSIKETRMTTLLNPETVAPFVNPILEQSFNSQLTKWYNPSGGAPIGNLISTPSIDEDAWHVNIDYDEWAMYQPLNGTSNNFKFAAIENKRVSFTFFAVRDNSDSKVRAMIRYTSPGDMESKVVVGDWVLLSNDEEWQQVSVTTTWRLPNDIETFEVWIIGESLPYCDFSAIIDESRLVIVADDTISLKHNWEANLGGECGIVSLNLATVYAYKPGGWSVKVMPIVVAQAAAGFCISELSIDFAVSHGQAVVADDGAIQANNKVYVPESFNLAEWNEMASFWKGIVKWGTRIAFYYTGIGAPLSWAFGDAIASGADIILTPYRRDGDQIIAAPENPGYLDVVYPVSQQISLATAGLKLLWDLASSYENPVLTVTFTVEFETTSGMPAYRSVSTMAVTFPTS